MHVCSSTLTWRTLLSFVPLCILTTTTKLTVGIPHVCQSCETENGENSTTVRKIEKKTVQKLRSEIPLGKICRRANFKTNFLHAENVAQMLLAIIWKYYTFSQVDFAPSSSWEGNFLSIFTCIRLCIIICSARSVLVSVSWKSVADIRFQSRPTPNITRRWASCRMRSAGNLSKSIRPRMPDRGLA